MLRRGADAHHLSLASAGEPEGRKETAEGAEEIREGAAQSGAQNVEDGTEEHVVSHAEILIPRLRILADSSYSKTNRTFSSITLLAF